MRVNLFSEDQFDQLRGEVVRVLGEVGYHVGHEKLKAMALAGGCRESAQGRVLFAEAQVADLKAKLEEEWGPTVRLVGAPSNQPVGTAVGLHGRRTLGFGFGNITPRFYSHPRRQAEGGNTLHLMEVTKFAQMDPRVTGLGHAIARQDTPPEIEQLESFLIMARLTDKPLGGSDTVVPESMPYIAAAGEALGYEAADFVGCCNCIIPPLKLEHRTAETMLRRAPYHSRAMMTSMVGIGASSPVDVAGSVVLGTAEIVGGLILAMLMDSQAPLMGYIASTQTDMRVGRITSSSPATVQVDAGVYQLMEARFGGGTRVGGRGYISATHPGLQATFERFLKAVGYAAYVDAGAVSYSGTGNLDNGSVLSPEQLLLDMEIMEGLDRLWDAPTMGGAAARIRATVLEERGSFLTAEHTLAHHREELWDPRYFRRLVDSRTEAEVLDECHAEYRARVEGYREASHPAEVVRELETIVEEARRDLVT